MSTIQQALQSPGPYFQHAAGLPTETRVQWVHVWVTKALSSAFLTPWWVQEQADPSGAICKRGLPLVSCPSQGPHFISESLHGNSPNGGGNYTQVICSHSCISWGRKHLGPPQQWQQAGGNPEAHRLRELWIQPHAHPSPVKMAEGGCTSPGAPCGCLGTKVNNIPSSWKVVKQAISSQRSYKHTSLHQTSCSFHQ